MKNIHAVLRQSGDYFCGHPECGAAADVTDKDVQEGVTAFICRECRCWNTIEIGNMAASLTGPIKARYDEFQMSLLDG